MTHDKVDLDGLLGGWPAPPRDDAAWEARADEIVRAAKAAPKNEETLDALLESPRLDAEEGEPKSDTGHPMVSAGDAKMSDEDQQSDASVPPEGAQDDSAERPSSLPSRRPRPSLREMAERASQAGLSRPPPPVAEKSDATATPLPGRPSRPSLATPAPGSARVSKPVEAGADDSGIVDLHVLHATVTAQQRAAAEKAKPASEGLFDDDEPAVAGAPAAANDGATKKRDSEKPVAAAAATAAAAPEKKGSGATAGLVIAVLGIAAAAFIYMRGNSAEPTATTAPVATEAAPPVVEEKPEAVAAATAEPAAEATAAPEASAAPAASGEAVAVADNTGGAAAPALGGPMPAGGGQKAAPSKAGGSENPGDLAAAMAQATGAEKAAATGGGAEKAEPASGGKPAKSVPEKPAQGSVQAAMGAVMGGAKACVAGADDVSRANITFGSSGSVKSVSVSGWAAGKSAAGCIKSALQGANVGPFSTSSFTLGVTIRP